MPEIFRAFGFSFMFFSREHEPIHVHVVGKDGMRNMYGMETSLFSTNNTESRLRI